MYLLCIDLNTLTL